MALKLQRRVGVGGGRCWEQREEGGKKRGGRARGTSGSRQKKRETRLLLKHGIKGVIEREKVRVRNEKNIPKRKGIKRGRIRECGAYSQLGLEIEM